MGALNWREGSTRLAYKSGYDFTSTGTNYYPTFQGVKFSSGTVVPCSAATDDIIGIIMNCPGTYGTDTAITGGTADILAVNAQGTGKVQAGGTIAVGNYLTMGTGGTAVAATQTTAGSQPTVRVFGRAVTAGASTDLIEYEGCFFLY